MTLPLLPLPPGAERFLAVAKPAGRAVHGPGSLLEELRAEHGPGLALVHRLDRETSGVLLLARDPEALREAHAAWGERAAKRYLARTRGVPAPPEGTVEKPLLENRTSRPDLLSRALRAAYGPARAGLLLAGQRVLSIPPIPPPGRTAVHPAGRPASTAYRVVSVEGGDALVELAPREGRMHQLRVHLAALGTPLRGDRFYDPLASPDDPTPFLHLASIVFRDPPFTPAGTVWTIEGPLP